MALSGTLTSTIQLRALSRTITSASKNKAFIADPVVLSALARDGGIGPFIGALLSRESLLDIGGSKAAAVAEGAAQTAATAVTPTNVAPTPTRREFARDLLDSERSHLAGLGRDELEPDILDSFAMEGYDTWKNTLTYDILDLASGASYSAGTTNTALSWAAVQNAYYDMVNRGAVDEAGAVLALKVKGVKDLASDVLSLGGAVQMANQVQQFLNIGKNGFIGEFFGGLRIYMLDDVETSSPDDIAPMFSSRGLATIHEIIPLPEELGEAIIVQAGGDMGWVTVEAKRSTTTSAATRVEVAFRFGVAARDPAAMTKVLYKST